MWLEQVCLSIYRSARESVRMSRRDLAIYNERRVDWMWVPLHLLEPRETAEAGFRHRPPGYWRLDPPVSPQSRHQRSSHSARRKSSVTGLTPLPLGEPPSVSLWTNSIYSTNRETSQRACSTLAATAWRLVHSDSSFVPAISLRSAVAAVAETRKGRLTAETCRPSWCPRELCGIQ